MMQNYLLDTNVISQYVAPVVNQAVINWLDVQDPQTLYLSEVTLAELYEGAYAEQYRGKKRGAVLLAWIKDIEAGFEDRILKLSPTIWQIWARNCALQQTKGRTLPAFDALLGATAQHHNLTIVTRNIKDFHYYPKVINPWPTEEGHYSP